MERKVRDLDEAMDPRLRPAQMTLDDAKSDLSKAVYAATDIIERLEGAGLIAGNGHHLRQELARHAVDVLEKRWIGDGRPS